MEVMDVTKNILAFGELETRPASFLPLNIYSQSMLFAQRFVVAVPFLRSKYFSSSFSSSSRPITWDCGPVCLFPSRELTGCYQRDDQSSAASSPSLAQRPSWTLTCSNSTSLRYSHLTPWYLMSPVFGTLLYIVVFNSRYAGLSDSQAAIYISFSSFFSTNITVSSSCISIAN